MKTKMMLMVVGLLLGGLWEREAQAFYNPSTGRWLNRDPKGESADGGLYVFVRNQPTVAFDRLGLDWVYDVALYPRQFNVSSLDNGEHGRTIATHSDFSRYKTKKCPCGIQMDDFRLRVRITEFFRGSEAQAQADGTIAHEDGHVAAYKMKWDEIASGAWVIYGKCVPNRCFSAWSKWFEAVQAHANAVANLEHDQVDFNDSNYDPTKKPTQAKMDADAAAVGAANAKLRAAQADKAAACGF